MFSFCSPIYFFSLTLGQFALRQEPALSHDKLMTHGRGWTVEGDEKKFY
jgi:hypothetical protein